MSYPRPIDYMTSRRALETVKENRSPNHPHLDSETGLVDTEVSHHRLTTNTHDLTYQTLPSLTRRATDVPRPSSHLDTLYKPSVLT